MGWGSGVYIFNPIADALIAADIDYEPKKAIASHVIKALQQQDWDTEDDSLDDYEHDPAIVAAFAENGIVRE